MAKLEGVTIFGGKYDSCKQTFSLKLSSLEFQVSQHLRWVWEGAELRGGVSALHVGCPMQFPASAGGASRDPLPETLESCRQSAKTILG